MRDFFRFWWQCRRIAASGTVPLARSVWWLLAVPVIGGLRYVATSRGMEAIIPNHPILDLDCLHGCGIHSRLCRCLYNNAAEQLPLYV